MQVVLVQVIALGIGSLACILSILFVTADMLDQHDLGLDLFSDPSSRVSVGLTQILALMILCVASKDLTLSGLCRNKFGTNFRVAAGWTENMSLDLRLFRVAISGLGPTRVGYDPLFLGLNSLWETALKNCLWSVEISIYKGALYK
jgi:hypothetical protein